jgi:hypothetical protein
MAQSMMASTINRWISSSGRTSFTGSSSRLEVGVGARCKDEIDLGAARKEFSADHFDPHFLTVFIRISQQFLDMLGFDNVETGGSRFEASDFELDRGGGQIENERKRAVRRLEIRRLEIICV